MGPRRGGKYDPQYEEHFMTSTALADDTLALPGVEDQAKAFEPCVLTPQQETMWHDTMSLMAWTAPGFRHLFYKLLVNHKGKYACFPTRRVPVAATDARNILINPDTFFKYDLKERVFIVGHEVMHNVYMDVPFLHRCQQSGTVPMSDGTTKPFNNAVMQRAMDYRINALLRDSRIGAPPKDCLLDDKIASANDSVTDVYKKLYEDYDANGTMPQDPGGFDIILQPGASTGQNPQQAQQNPQQWAVEIKAAQTIEAMKAQGKMAGALQRMFEEVLNPKVHWTDMIRGIFNRKVGSGSYDWRRPDRRFICRDLYMPSRSGNGAGWVVCWGDTSGSIGEKELCQYMAELGKIVEDCMPKRLTICWCDDALDEERCIDELDEASDMAHLQAKVAGEGVIGGGGTSVQPVFDWLAKQQDKPEVFIAFTDGYVGFPDTNIPDCVLIWASTSKPPEQYPYGDVVMINPESPDA